MSDKELQIIEDRKKLKNKSKIIIMAIVFVLLLVTVVSSSLAWMAISRTPVVSDLNLSVLTASRLEIAPDEDGTPGEWDVTLDLSTVLENLSPLRPVTYSAASNGFYAMSYGLDGRADGATIALTDDRNANVKSDGSASGTEDGYYIVTTFWLKAPTTAYIYLSDAVEVEKGTAGAGTYVVGNPVWNDSTVTHENGGHGMETALRIGFLCQSTDQEGKPIGDAVFFIYEPNGDAHVTGETGYANTPSIDGTETLVPESRLIWQTASTWNETAPVLSSDVVYTLGEFQSKPELFMLKENTYEKVTMYVWLEGQDADCINTNANTETSILANIQFSSNEDEIDTGIERDEE